MPVYPRKSFTITADGNSPTACYVQQATFRGKPLQRCFVPLRDIQKGGTLKLTMGSRPNQTWGTGEMPPSMSDGKP